MPTSDVVSMMIIQITFTHLDAYVLMETTKQHNEMSRAL